MGRPGAARDGVDTESYEADLRYLAEACVDAAARWGAELLFVLPEIPQNRPAGVGDDGNPHGVLATAVRAREALRHSLAGRDRVALVDGEALLRTVGAAHAYRPALLASAQIPYSEEYFALLAERIGRLLALRRDPRPPLIVLDEALTGDGAPQPAAPDLPGGDRGKGTPETSLDAYLTEVARLGATVTRCTAEGPATGQLRSLIERSVPAGRRVAFLSTRPQTLEQVRQDLPAVTTLLLPPDRELWAQAVDRSGIVDQAPVSGGPAAGGSGPSAPTLTLDGFLANLRLRVECAALTPELAEAAADLTRRTAEFHLDGEVWPAERFTATAPGEVRWAIRVGDRFGDHGLCGLLGARPEAGTLRVDLWVLTCPVLGKGVEERVLGDLVALAREHGCHTVAFRFRPTPRNDAFHRFLTGLWPQAAALGEVPGPVDIPVRVLAAGATAGPASGVAATPAPTAAARPDVSPPARAGRPRRRPVVVGGTATAAQILRAVEDRGRTLAATSGPGRTDEGGEPRTETERLIADVFAGVLRRPSVGVECRFFDHGDSMLAVQLIAKANRAGLRLTLRQVFQHQTVAALAAVATVVEQRQTSPESGGPAPLLPLQSWFFGLGLDRPGHFNQSQRFELPAEVDAGALEQAVAALLAQHPSLRVRFTREASGLCQTDPGAPADAPFEHVDLSTTPSERWEQRLEAHETALHRTMSPAEGRLARFALFTFGPERLPQLLVIFHHLAIDGMSWRFLLADLQDAYHQARRGGPVELAPTSTPMLSWARQLHAYAQSPEVLAELPRWLAEPRASVEPLPRDVPDAAASGVLTHSRLLVLSAEETRLLRDRALSTDHVSLDILLLAAANRSLARWSGRDRFLFDVVNHGREPFLDGVDLSRTVGWMVLNVPVLFETAGLEDMSVLVPAVGRQLRAWSSHHGAGDNLLRFLSEDESVRRQLAELPGADVLFSYAGHIDPGSQEHPLLGASIPGGVPDIDPGAVTPYALQFDTVIVGDRIHLEICYRGTQFHTTTTERLMDGWAAGLRELIGGTPAAPAPASGPTTGRASNNGAGQDS